MATANKETLVAGGHLVMPLARGSRRERARRDARRPARQPARLAPADRLGALGDLAVPRRRTDGRVARLILTASGGPFLDATRRPVAAITPEQALRHPTWSMGAKITIDSATLANKGLEVIEAHWLYDVDYDAIDVVIHPQSVVHSAVRFVDGSLKAQLGTPDMRLPIQYALTYPDRRPSPAAAADLLADRPARLPRARRGPLPGPPDRPRGRPDRPARHGGADRGRRGRGRPVPRRDPRLRRASRGSSSAAVERVRRRAPTRRPDLDELIALDAEVRARRRDRDRSR